MRICMGCMEKIEDAAEQCPLCGYHRNTPPREAYHLPPETILNGRYIVGRVIGYGGFGVTYLGLDYQLDRKVAIKEYLPSDFATRMPGDVNLTVYANDAQEQFAAGLQSFVDEAHRLARFNSKPGIVDIYDSFSQNYTAYIVMQYLEGKTVKQLLQEEGIFPYERARDIIVSVLESLGEVHKENIIHRDVAPDNIFITNDGDIKLLDFGAARFATTFHSKSLSVILKPGYAPEEQYRSRGNQGPWTDVYAAAATFYKMITGVTPEESMERAMKDTVQEPSRLGIEIPKSAETAIMNAMNVKAEDRTQSAPEFRDELAGGEVERKKSTIKRYDSGGFPSWLKAMIACVGGLAVIGIALSLILGPGTEPPPPPPPPPDLVVTPGIINKNVAEAKEITEQAELRFLIVGKESSDKADKDLVLRQAPLPGRQAEKGSNLEITVSAGPESEYVPNVCDKPEEAAVGELESLGFRVRTQREHSDTAPGAVISQDAAVDTYLSRNSIISLVVSDGLLAAAEEKEVVIPELSGLSFDQAKTELNDLGLYVVITKEEYHHVYERGRVIGQDIRAGAKVMSGGTIGLVVSSGIELARVPDLEYRTEEEAIRILENAKLRAEVGREPSKDTAEGLVIRQDIPLGSQVEMGTAVKIVVSMGDVLIVPDLLGMNVLDALDMLTDMEIDYVVTFTDTNKTEMGPVIQQYPPEGSVRERSPSDTRGITLEVFLEKYAVNIVVDMSEKAFNSYVADQNKNVESSAPAAGTPRTSPSSSAAATAPRTTVPRTTSPPPTTAPRTTQPPTTAPKPAESDGRVPNLIGFTLSQARTRIANAGLVLDIITYVETDNENEDGYVIDQSIPSGEIVDRGSLIDIAVYKYTGSYD